jgi:hypothetical protein
MHVRDKIHQEIRERESAYGIFALGCRREVTVICQQVNVAYVNWSANLEYEEKKPNCREDPDWLLAKTHIDKESQQKKNQSKKPDWQQE